MNADQEIRAAAAQAAATLMAPLQPLPEDFFAVADSIAVFIEQGPDAAVAVAMAGIEKVAEVRTPEPAPIVAPTVTPVVASVMQPLKAAPEPVPDVVEEVAAEPEKDAEVIPLSSVGQVPAKQQAARRIIEKTRKERVDNLMAQASVAKAKVHKMRLVEQAEEAELSEYPVVVKGEPTTLGTYLASL